MRGEKKKPLAKEVIELTKELFHGYFCGNLDPWFSHLCEDSVWLGNGEPILFGKEAIENHFKHLRGVQHPILHEDYYLVSFSDHAAQMCGQYLVGKKNDSHLASVCFSMGFRMMGGEWKIVHQHHSYEYIQKNGSKAMKLQEMDPNTMQFIKNMFVKQGSGENKISIRSGNQLLSVNAQSILYVQSHRNKSELICLDKTIPCNMSLGNLKKILPEEFYPIHRCYLVNTRHVLALRRFEVELPFGILLSVPAKKYKQVQADFERIL